MNEATPAQTPQPPSPEMIGKANKLMEELLLKDMLVKQSLALQLIGMKIVHYGFTRLRMQLAELKVEKELIDLAATHAMHIAKSLSMEGFDSRTLIANIVEVDRVIRADVKAEKDRVKKVQHDELSLGLPTPCKRLNDRLKGGLRAGSVVVLCGESPAVFGTLALFYRAFNRRNVPITHMGMAAQKDMPDVPGVRNLCGHWWRGGCSSFGRAKEVFNAVVGHVALIDRLDGLMGEMSDEPVKKVMSRTLKMLFRMASRYKFGAVVGFVGSPDSVPQTQGVIRVPVDARRLDGKPVMLVDDEIMEEKADGGSSVPGSGADGASGLGAANVSPEVPAQLETGDKAAEAGGVEGDGAVQST